MIYGKALLLSKQILRTHMQIKRGFSGTSKSQNSHIWHVANTLDKDATPSAELPRIFRKFPTTKWTFPLTCNSCISYKADFSWQGSLNIRMRYPENGWYEENDYIAFASASFRKKKTQKAFRGLPRLQSGTIFQVLWHNPAYHYVENKWRCSTGILSDINPTLSGAGPTFPRRWFRPPPRWATRPWPASTWRPDADPKKAKHGKAIALSTRKEFLYIWLYIILHIYMYIYICIMWYYVITCVYM